MEKEHRGNISSEGATSEASHDLYRTFGAIFRDDLEALDCHPMLVYAAPLVLNNFSLRNISYNIFFKKTGTNKDTV